MIVTSSRIGQSLVFIASLAVLLAGIDAAMKQPIYPDEVSYKIFLGRYFLNGGFKQSLMPFCEIGFRVAAPVSLLPAAALWSLISKMGYEWWSYRLLPLAALAFIVVTLLARAALQRRWPIWHSWLMLCCGPAIYSLVLLRPEVIIIAVALAIYLLLRQLSTEQGPFVVIAVGTLVYLLLSLILFIHPKALYLAPLCLGGFVYLAYAAKQKMLAGLYIGLVTLTLILVVNSLSFQHIQHLACPEASFIEANFSGQAVNPLQSFLDPSRFLHSLVSAFSGQMLYLKMMLLQFHTQYKIDYLPRSSQLSRVIRIANVGFVALALVAFGTVVVRLIRGLLINRRQDCRFEWLLLFLLSAGLFIPVLLNLSGAFYEGASFIAAVAVTLELTRTASSPEQVQKSVAKQYAKFAAGLIVFILAVISVQHIRQVFTPVFDSQRNIGPGYGRYAKDAVVQAAVAKLTRFVPPGDALIIDDLTYEFVQAHPIIMPITYLGLAAVSDRTKVENALNHYNVHYAIVRCASFLPSWFPGWVKEGEIDLSGYFRDVCLYGKAR